MSDAGDPPEKLQGGGKAEDAEDSSAGEIDLEAAKNSYSRERDAEDAEYGITGASVSGK